MDIMTWIKFIYDLIKIGLKPFLNILQWIYNKLPFEVKRKRRLGIIESPWKDHEWAYGKDKNGHKIVVLYTYWNLTNTLPYNLTTLNTYLKKPEKVKGTWMVEEPETKYWGHYAIPINRTSQIEIIFVIDPKYVKQVKKPLDIEIEITDPINNKYRIKGIQVPERKIQLPKKQLFHVEDISKLKSDTERKVVSVLKNELEQYKFRGRREGRLGTVEWIKTDLQWTSSDSTIRFLYEKSEKNYVQSIHVTALVNLYKNSNTDDKDLIIKSLLKRLDKKSEYLNVAYLILFTLFELGFLNKAFTPSLQKLYGDKENGFSDMLRMIDFLLAYRYDEFNEELINEIEQFVYSTKEHSFRIKERINAIRVKNMIALESS
ncbi:MAG TPA: hypothetical protein PLS49_02335 [Candidatus Woesebacteria bacterium]|nr:hypothetical protein [Candidatus Woesebacteria bacterium]